jgi:hypothetical protein
MLDMLHKQKGKSKGENSGKSMKERTKIKEGYIVPSSE